MPVAVTVLICSAGKMRVCFESIESFHVYKSFYAFMLFWWYAIFLKKWTIFLLDIGT